MAGENSRQAFNINPAHSGYEVAGVPLSRLHTVWDAAAELLQRALDRSHDELTLGDIKKLIAGKKFQLWIVFRQVGVLDAVAVTEVVEYPAMRVCRIVMLAGGAMEEWMRALDASLCVWATALGCKRLEAYARPGFKKALAALGVRHLYDVVGKDLENRILH